MLQPYTHQEALAQFPVSYELGDGREITLYPLTLNSVLILNRAVKDVYLSQFADDTNEFGDAVDYMVSQYKEAKNLTFEKGVGKELFNSTRSLNVLLVKLLCRGALSDEEIKQIIFPNQILDDVSHSIVSSMLGAVTCPIPTPPILNIPPKPPKYQSTEEESQARIFKMFAEKFGWDYKMILDLTEYQVFWYSYLFADEREHIEEMMTMGDNVDRGYSDNSPSPSYQSGSILHLNSQDEIDAWIKSQKFGK